ncbi:hypothetical protein D3C87_1500000 [compost metagenome]
MEHNANSLANLAIVSADGFSVDDDLAMARRGGGCQAADSSALASTIGTKKGEYTPLLHFKRYIVDRFDTSVIFL